VQSCIEGGGALVQHCSDSSTIRQLIYGRRVGEMVSARMTVRGSPWRLASWAAIGKVVLVMALGARPALGDEEA
jgi:hypothetical protein